MRDGAAKTRQIHFDRVVAVDTYHNNTTEFYVYTYAVTVINIFF